MTEVYYVEWDKLKAAWLAQLVKEKAIPPGPVDTRDIRGIDADDFADYERVSLFAGIGGWERGLALAGWDEPVWCVSCPCPPISNAGKKKTCPKCGGKSPVPCPMRTGYFLCLDCEHGWHADERHLWPEVWRLVEQRRPPAILGEQVVSRVGRAWLSTVRLSLEMLGYAVGAADMCSAGVGAPNIRQRFYFGARLVDGLGAGLERHDGDERDRGEPGRLGAYPAGSVAETDGTGGLANADGGVTRDRELQPGRQHGQQPEDCSVGRLGFAYGDRPGPRVTASETTRHRGPSEPASSTSGTNPHHVDWRDTDWLFCRDGKWRPVESSVQRLVDGVPAGVVPDGSAAFPLAKGEEARRLRLSGYGDAVNPYVVAAFARAFGATSC